MPTPVRHKKRVLIDASPVTNSTDGLSVYIINLIRNLPTESLADFDYTVLVNPDVDRSDLNKALQRQGIREMRASIASIGPRRDLDMYHFLKRHASTFDLIHITSNNYPFTLNGGICTIHDVTFKSWFDRPNRIPGTAWLARFFLDQVIRRSLRRASAVIAVSRSTRDEIERLFNPTPREIQKIQVIHEGWEHFEADTASDCLPFPFEVNGYLLFLGSHRLHKNLSGLLEAFLIAADRIPKRKVLVISGSSDRLSSSQRALVDKINAVDERVLFTGYVSQQCVSRLYQHADALILPSLSEGFGLPVLEAFHFGVPLLASNATALPEVAGDAALYFDPYDPGSIAAAIVRFYENPPLAEELRAAGKRQLQHFSWVKAASETVELYRSVISLTS